MSNETTRDKIKVSDAEYWEATQHIRMIDNYNAEVARGIVHTKEWVEKMKELQNKFNVKVTNG